MQHPDAYLSGIAYPGRGLLLGLTPDSRHAVAAYFIMGRSANSRNRVFVADGEGLRIQAHDPALLSDPSLVIYWPLRKLSRALLLSNGDQTDTLHRLMSQGGSFEQALRQRTFEPDAPNYTPRISGLADFSQGYGYRLSILKRDGQGGCQRFFYEYGEPEPGVGRLIHTYQGDGQPLPSFSGEPVALAVPDDIDRLTRQLWQGLNRENRVALFVRYINIADGSYDQRIINKHQ